MPTIAFVDAAIVEPGSLTAQIYDAVKQALPPGQDVIDIDRETPGEEGLLRVSVFPRGNGDVLIMHDLADRGHFEQTDGEGVPCVQGFGTVLVPGHWLRRRLLANGKLGLGPSQVTVAGSPRIDHLRALAAARPARAPGARPRVLFAPLHENWKDSKGNALSCRDVMAPFLPKLAEMCELVEHVDPRNLAGKVPITEALLDADVVITDYTSVMYEAWALDKPVIFPRWLVGDRVIAKASGSAEAHVYTARIGHHAGSFAELCAWVSQGAALGLGAGVANFIDDYIADHESGRAAERTAALLESLVDPRRRDSLIAITMSGAEALAAKDYPKAEALYSQAVLLDEFDGALFLALASALKGQRKFAAEARALEAALALDRQNAAAYLKLGEAEDHCGRPARAARAYGNAIERNPIAPSEWFYKLGHAIEQSDGPTVVAGFTAERAYERACALDTKRKAARFGVGALHAASGRWPEAATAYAKTLRAAPFDADLHFRTGMANDRCYEWAAAERHYRAAVAIKNKKPDWHFRLGFVLERQGRHAEAAAAFLHAAETAGEHRRDWFYRAGYALEKSGDPRAACAAFARMEVGPEYDDYELPTQPDPYLQQFVEDHLALYRDVLAAEPRNLTILGKYGTLLQEAGSPREANEVLSQMILLTSRFDPKLYKRYDDQQAPLREQAQIEELLAADCSNAHSWMHYAAILTRVGTPQEVVSAMRQAVLRSDLHRPEWYILLGRALVRCERFTEACAAFRESSILQRAHGAYEDRFAINAELREQATYREFYDTLPLIPNTILYESFGGEGLSDNPLALFRQIESDPRFADWLHVWVVDSLAKVPPDLLSRRDVIFVTKSSISYQRWLCTASYLINNATFPATYVRKDGQKFLATWHGTPLKTLGYDIAATPLQRANTARNLIQASMFIAPNVHTENVMLRRYGVKNVFSGVSLISGYPRIDMMLNATDAAKARIRERLKLDPSKPLVLYAPTYRGHWKTPELEAEALVQSLQAMLSPDYNLVFRGHYFAERMIAQLDLPVMIAPHSIDSCELLSIVDVLVSDYSSIFYDFLLTDRPVIHYVHDWDRYVESRGVYFPKAELPGIVCEDEASLIAAVRAAVRDPAGQIGPAYRAARELFCSADDGHASERVVEAFFFGDLTVPVPPLRDTTKRQLLFYCGDLDATEITATAEAYLRATAAAGYENTIMVDRRVLIDDDERIVTAQGLVAYGDVLIRFGATGASLEEAWVTDRFGATNRFASPAIEAVYRQMLRHEVRRILGSAAFDAAIDLDGNRPFWTQLFAAMNAETKVFRIDGDMQAHRDGNPHLDRIFPALGRYHAVVSATPSLRDRNESTLAPFGIDPDRLKVLGVPTGPVGQEQDDPDLARFAQDGRRRIVNLEGALPISDYVALFDGVRALVERGEDVALYLLGDVSDPLLLARLAAAKAVADRTVVLGWKADRTVFLELADCVVFVGEASGLPDVEARAAGVPCVTASTSDAIADGVAEALSSAAATPNFDAAAHDAQWLGAFAALVGGPVAAG